VRSWRDVLFDSISSNLAVPGPGYFLLAGVLPSINGKGWQAPRPFFRRPAMGKKLYVGNLPYGIGSSELQQLFENYKMASNLLKK